MAQGKTHSQIRKILGLSAHTVRKFMRAATAGQVITGPIPRASRIGRFAPYRNDPRTVASMHCHQRLIQPASAVTVARRIGQGAPGLSSRRSSEHGDYLAIT
jgi:predicted transcriptional regulator